MPNHHDSSRDRKMCPYCGTEVIEGSKFCIGCGKPLVQSYIIPQNQRSNNVCPYCGRALRGNETFCNYCGNNLNKTNLYKPQLRNDNYSNSINRRIQQPYRDNQYRNDRPSPRRRDLNSDSYQTNYILIILYFLVIVTVIFNIFLGLFFILASAIAVYYDAKNIITVRRSEKIFASSTWSPLSWGAVTFCFWLIGHSLYLITRRSIWENNRYPNNSYDQRKSDGSLASVVAVIIILFVFFIIFTPVLIFSNGLSKSNNYIPLLSVQTIKPTQSNQEMSIGESAQTFSIGDMVKIGNFQFTFNSAEWNTGGEYSFNSPEAGEKWLVVDCTIKNLDTESVPVSSLLMFALYDADGYSKDRTLFADLDGSLDGELGSGRQMRGQLAYSVDSTDNGPWELVFDPSIFGFGQAIFGFSASDVR